MKFKVGDKVKVTAEAAAELVNSSAVVDKPYLMDWLSQEHTITDVVNTTSLSKNWPYQLSNHFHFSASEIELVPNEPTFAQKEVDKIIDPREESYAITLQQYSGDKTTGVFAISPEQLAAIRNILGE